MPSAATHPTPLSINVGAFVPKKILTKNVSGQEVNLATLQRVLPAAVPPVLASSTSVPKDTKRPPIRLRARNSKKTIMPKKGQKKATAMRAKQAKPLPRPTKTQLPA
jgi:hypothetical protein